jgi:galactosyl transferase GMA12/MNN10 family
MSPLSHDGETLNLLANVKSPKPHRGWIRVVGLPLVLIMLASHFYYNARQIRNVVGQPSRNRNTVHGRSRTKTKKRRPRRQDWAWMDTTGIKLWPIQGNPNVCQDVIYTGNTHTDPRIWRRNNMVHESWKGLSYAVRTFPKLQQTCLVYFQIANPYHPKGHSSPLHPVWARLPATAAVMMRFPKAKYFLYLDSDALLASSDHNPTTMYQAISYDGANSTQQQPALIVHKPTTGWLFGECQRFGLGYRCLNSGALLWHRSQEANTILQAWWESRHSKRTENFFKYHSEEPFIGWHQDTQEERLTHEMGVTNRLMYTYHTNQAVHGVWPAPRDPAGKSHLPCLLNEWAYQPSSNAGYSSCPINHFNAYEEMAIQRTALMLESGTSSSPEDFAMAIRN